MSKNFLVIPILSLLLGCTTTSRFDMRNDKIITPPPYTFLGKWSRQPLAALETLTVGEAEHNIRWWKLYSVGLRNLTDPKKTNLQKACESFTLLSQDSDFPLKTLALLRAHESCTDKKVLAALPETVDAWYSDLQIDLQLTEAKTTTDLSDDIKFLISKARTSIPRRSKEQYYQEALEKAQKLQDTGKIVEITEMLHQSSPRLITEPKESQYKDVANDFRTNRQFKEALDYYQKILEGSKTPEAEKFRALKDIRQTYKISQNKKAYVEATKKIFDWTEADLKKNKKNRYSIQRHHDAISLHARTLWTEDQRSNAEKILNTGIAQLKGKYPLTELYLIQGRIEEEKGEFQKALTYFELSYAEKSDTTSLKDKVLWLKAWNYYKLDKWTEAETSFQQMLTETSEVFDKYKAKYWLGRTFQKLNKIDEAAKSFEELLNEDSAGYYGVLAHREIGKEFKPLTIDHEAMNNMSLLSVKELSPEVRLTIEWLIAVNEKTIAERALSIEADHLKNSKVTDEKTWLTVTSAFARAGLYLPIFSTVGSLPNEVKDQLIKNHPDLLFPTPFEDIIKAAGKRAGVPVEFIYSIIRQESAFNPEARSPVDAMGLMQLLPSIAKKIATRNNLEYSEAHDLFVPEINIPLGAFELRTLSHKYNNQFILAVSGYNANDAAIRGWLKTRFRADSTEFIEEVPYEETRGYIKLTMRNFIFYKRLINSDKPFAFPEELLKLNNPQKK